jgi:hypothetical protein
MDYYFKERFSVREKSKFTFVLVCSTEGRKAWDRSVTVGVTQEAECS